MPPDPLTQYGSQFALGPHNPLSSPANIDPDISYAIITYSCKDSYIEPEIVKTGIPFIIVKEKSYYCRFSPEQQPPTSSLPLLPAPKILLL